jgi:threonine aldolase
MDGARIFNALVETNENPHDYGKYFDSISICLSKGLGAPVGSVLLASKDNIKRAKRIRKVLGGGMRQAGYLAAAGIYALDNNINRLKDDHRRAKELEMAITRIPGIEILPVMTNIVIAEFPSEKDTVSFVHYLKDHQILVSQFTKTAARMVTHLNFDDSMLEHTIETLEKYRS